MEGLMGVCLDKALDNSDCDVLLRRVMGQLLLMSSVTRSEADLPDNLGWSSRKFIYKFEPMFIFIPQDVKFLHSHCEIGSSYYLLFVSWSVSSLHGSMSSDCPHFQGRCFFCPLCPLAFSQGCFLAHSRLGLKPYSQ